MPKILDEWLGYCKMTEIVPKSGSRKEHNKWWAICILEDDDSSYRVHTLYAALGQKGSEHIERYNKSGQPLLLKEARLLFDTSIREKENPRKGYVQKSFNSPFGTPKPVTVPSFALRFSSPSPTASQGNTVSAILLPSQGHLVSPASAMIASGGMSICTHCGTQNYLQEEFCSNCGMALAASPGLILPLQQQTPALHIPLITSSLVGPLPVGYRLNQARYTIEVKIGEGGMGAVYKAKDHMFAERLVAIKELIPDPQLNDLQLLEAHEAFKFEAMLLSSLSHQSLPRIYDHFVDGGRSYLVMDFIEGKPLEQMLAESPDHRLPVERVLSIGIALSDVLDYLHTCTPPIIFRDLKPGNVMITERGHVYLIDFGIARAYKFGQVKDTVALGSSGYAAPEQYGKAQSLPKTDIYGLGATLHHMLTGFDPSEHPFFFAPFPEKVLAEVEDVPDLGPLVFGMVKMALKDRQPANAAKVKAALQTMLIALTVPVSTLNPSSMPAMRKRAKRSSLSH